MAGPLRMQYAGALNHVPSRGNARHVIAPGRGIPSNHISQFQEQEYVKAEEFYDHFLDDPSDFMLRTYLPRVCVILEPFKAVPPPTTWFGYYMSILTNTAFFGTTEMTEAIKSLLRAGAEALKWGRNLDEEALEIRSMGYPSMSGGGVPPHSTLLGTGSEEPEASCSTCSGCRRS